MPHLTIEQLIKETYATHYLLRNLEFPAEDIFVGVPLVANAETPGRNATVQLRHAGKQFTIILGPIFSDQEENEYINKWTEFAYSQPHQRKMVSTERRSGDSSRIRIAPER